MARRAFHIKRDVVLFVFGLSGIAYETLSESADRPYLLILFAGMVGLPAFLYRDESKTDLRKILGNLISGSDEEEKE